MRSVLISFFLCLGGFLGVAGLHRIYLGQIGLGLAYFFTGGFFGIGTIIDLIRMPQLVENTNLKIAQGKISARLPGIFRLVNPERTILRLAQENNNTVTPQIVVMNSSLSLHEAKAELERLRKEGYCSLDIAEDGSDLYRFYGLKVGNSLL